MTRHRTLPGPAKVRQRRTQAELEALRFLAREAALRGETRASIRARLQIPDSTMTDWAKQDGYRRQDLKARAEEAAAAAETAQADADAIRQQAEEMWGLMGDLAGRAASPAQRQVELARVRTLALAEAGYLDAAEAEIAAVRRLARLLAFGRAGSGEMERFQRAAAAEARRLRLEAMCDGLAAEREAEAARAAAGLPPPPPPPASAPMSPEDLAALLEDLKQSVNNRDPWKEIAEYRRREEGASGRAHASTSLEP